MNADQAQKQSQPAWRQFWFWFVLAPPMASIVVGLSLVYTAVTQGDDKVVDNYYDAGRAIHKDFEMERQARDMGLEARMSVDREDGGITLHLQGEQSLPESISLYLSHATQAKRDQTLELEAEGGGLYRGNLGQPVHGRHYIRLQDPDGHWRLNATLGIHDEQLEILSQRNGG